MKRTLSLVLALVMILGSFTTVFAAEAVDTAAEFLEKEGVLLGDDEGDLMLEDNLERRDAVVLLSRLLGAEDVAAEFTVTEESPSWEDARTDAYYLPLFAWAEVNGYFEGNDDGTFAPRNAITAPEFSLVLLRALGYEVNGHEAWAASLEQAEELGLLEGVEVEFEDFVVRGEMAVMIFNALGTEMNNSTITLAEFLEIEMPVEEVTELEAEVNDTVNLMEIVVELSNADLASATQLEAASNYGLSGNRNVVAAELVGDDVVLLLDGPLVRAREYTLTIKNIDKEINDEYKFKAYDNTVPAVESVEVLGEYGIKVTTTEPVKLPLERNFLIDGRNVAMEVEQYGRDIILTPYHNRAFDEKAEELTILEIEDYANFRSTSVIEAIEVLEDEVGPEVVSSTMFGNKVTVEFDKDIYKASVKDYSNYRNLGNISYVEGRTTFYATEAEKVDTNKVVYTFENTLPRNVELTLEGVQNHSKVAMDKTDIAPVLVTEDSFAGVITNNDKMVKIEIPTNDPAKKGDQITRELDLVVKFDKNIDKDADEDNFVIYEREVNTRGKNAIDRDEITIENVTVDGKEVTLSIVNLRVNTKDRDYDYVLEVRNLRDADDNRIARDYLDFEVVHESPASTFKIESVDVNRKDNSLEFALNFDQYVDRDAAADAKNYFFKGASDDDDLDELDGYVIVERNGKTVTLVLPIIDEDHADFFKDYNVLEVSRRVTRGSNGDRLADANRVWNFDKDGANNNELEDAKAAADKEAAAAVDALINAIGTMAEIAEGNFDEEAVEAARAAYDELTDAQKDLVIAYGKLEAAEDYEEPVEEEEEDVKADFATAVGNAIYAIDLGELVEIVYDEDTKTATATIKEDADLGEFAGTGAMVALQALVDEAGLVSYQIDGLELRPLTDASQADIKEWIIVDFGLALDLDLEAGLAEVDGQEVSATVTLADGITDVYTVTFVVETAE